MSSQKPGTDENEAITVSETADLAKIMDIKYAPHLKGRFFHIETAKGKGAGISLATIILRNADESFYYPVEGRIDSRDQNLSHKDGCLFLIDYIEAYFEEFFQEEENVFLPIDWSPFSCEEIRFQLKGQILNRKTEAMADLILNEGTLQ